MYDAMIVMATYVRNSCFFVYSYEEVVNIDFLFPSSLETKFIQ